MLQVSVLYSVLSTYSYSSGVLFRWLLLSVPLSRISVGGIITSSRYTTGPCMCYHCFTF